MRLCSPATTARGTTSSTTSATIIASRIFNVRWACRSCASWAGSSSEGGRWSGGIVEALADLADDLTLLLEEPGKRSSYHLLVARIEGGAARRRRVFDALAARNIRCQVHYIPVHLQPWYQKHVGTREGDFPRAEAFYAGCLSLPLFPAMADRDVDRVADALRAALSER